MITYITPNSKEHKEYEAKSKEQQARHMCTADKCHECIECGSEDIYCDSESPEDFYVGGPLLCKDPLDHHWLFVLHTP